MIDRFFPSKKEKPLAGLTGLGGGSILSTKAAGGGPFGLSFLLVGQGGHGNTGQNSCVSGGGGGGGFLEKTDLIEMSPDKYTITVGGSTPTNCMSNSSGLSCSSCIV